MSIRSRITQGAILMLPSSTNSITGLAVGSYLREIELNNSLRDIKKLVYIT
ncbi:MAG: hypothetical protein ACRBF0_24265 [Calditrichia bacterium]